MPKSNIISNSGLGKFMALIADGLSLLEPKEKKRIVFHMISNTFFILIDTFAITTVTPLVALIVEPDLLYKNEILKMLYTKGNFVSEVSFLKALGFSALAFIFIGRIGKIAAHYFIRNFGIDCQIRFSKDLLSKSLNSRFVWHLSQNSTKLSHYVYTDVLMWSNDFVQRIVNLPSFLLSVLLSLIAFISFSPTAGLISTLTLGLIFCLIFMKIKSSLKLLSEDRRTFSNGMAASSNLFYSGIREIKLSKDPSFFIEYFLDVYGKYSHTMVKFKFLQLIPNTIIFLSGQAIAIVIALYLNDAGYSKGQLTAIMALLLLIISKLIPIASNTFSEISLIINTAPYISALKKLTSELDNNSEVLSDPSRVQGINSDWKKIFLKNINYSYPGKDDKTLSDISFDLQRGNMYGIVGPSGGGKTTLINNLLGLLTPTGGEILLDETPLSSIKKASWFQEFGVVPQKTFLIEGTLAQNIALGVEDNDISKERLDNCIKLAELEDVVSKLPEGINSAVNSDGSNFSGGQQQRISIARALYHNPNILLLDEATSSLDTFTEKSIMSTLNSLKRIKTIIFITHKINCVRECDSILFIENGKVSDSGSFEQLKKSNEKFMAILKEYSSEG